MANTKPQNTMIITKTEVEKIQERRDRLIAGLASLNPDNLDMNYWVDAVKERKLAGGRTHFCTTAGCVVGFLPNWFPQYFRLKGNWGGNDILFKEVSATLYYYRELVAQFFGLPLEAWDNIILPSSYRSYGPYDKIPLEAVLRRVHFIFSEFPIKVK